VKVRTHRLEAVDPSLYYLRAVTQEANGPQRRLRGAAMIETTDLQLKADEIDYNEDTQMAEARGHVHFEHYVRGEKLDCDRAVYDLGEETGTFYNISGTAPAQVRARPGLLTTTNPYYFQGKWAERLKDHYILHDGFLTDCVVPRPTWILKGPVFDVVPGDHAIARHSWFYLKGVPLFYAPYFYKSLNKQPRKSGFLIPNIGRSSLHGEMFGAGYYWAINRSYDLTYRGQYFTEAGLVNHVELRGRPGENTGFDLSVFGIKDNQETVPDQSGYRITLQGKSDLGRGWEARGELDYLSNFAFLQNFTQSFNEAVSSETHSVGFIARHWANYGLDFVAQRNVNFQSNTPGDTIEIRKLPEVDFTARDREIGPDKFPVWVAFDASAGLLDRSQPLFQTRQFVDRVDLAPHVSTAFRWHGIDLVPTFGIRETEYGSSFVNGQLTGSSFLRSTRDVTVDLILPLLERVFDAPSWMGAKVKHVIEPRVTYKYLTGVDDFQRVIRFDENDLLTNTNQVEFSLTNRLLAKDKNGTVSDFLIWQLRYARYFDPTFGGAVTAGQRNVIDSSLDLTGYSFFNGPRNYSPIVSVFRVQSRVGLEWRTDYDLLRHGISNTSVTLDGRINQYFWSAGHTDVKTIPGVAPGANQLRATIGYGNQNRRGWNSGFSIYYDFHQGMLQYWQTQVTYNTDCCGISVQYRRFSIGTRNDSQFEAAFAVSNIGTFGTLKKQDRMF
jgi:LPS-assembly protein